MKVLREEKFKNEMRQLLQFVRHFSKFSGSLHWSLSTHPRHAISSPRRTLAERGEGRGIA